MSDIWTIGHSTKPIEQLTRELHDQHISLLADVRRFPGSRRCPWFASDALSDSLQHAGIAYLWMGEYLGGRRRNPLEHSPNGAWTHPAFRSYADHMLTHVFADALLKLEHTATQHRTAIMCAEAQWWRCHRRLISDRLTINGWTVHHIMSTKTTLHEVTPWALIEQHRLTYPPLQGSLMEAP